MLATKMTRKGQVTIPAEIRERLDLHEGEVFVVHEEDGRVIFESQLQRLRKVLETSARYFADIPPLEPDDIRRLASESIADSVAEKLARIEQDRLED